METCFGCLGDGKCAECLGGGEVDDGEACPECDGDGDCRWCGGSGELDEEEGEFDDEAEARRDR